MGDRVGVGLLEGIDVPDGFDGFGARAAAFAIVLDDGKIDASIASGLFQMHEGSLRFALDA